MVVLSRSVNLIPNFSSFGKLFANFSPTLYYNSNNLFLFPKLSYCNQNSSLHTTNTHNNSKLMEFFDDEKNWGKKKIVTGRSWILDELRLKSNEDLHKLWYVLLKERNMLITMEHAYKEAWEPMPNPERLDKVEESMENLETVVRERNEAYYQLETGQSGERPSKVVNNILGLQQVHRFTQHYIPKWMNKSWREKLFYLSGFNGHAVRKFLSLYKEKLLMRDNRIQKWETRRCLRILKLYPHVDMELLEKKFPNADMKRVKNANDYCAISRLNNN